MIEWEEIRVHKEKESAWIVIKGRVYDITEYAKKHPGGPDILLKHAGTDCTKLFNSVHPWVNHEHLLRGCLIGRVRK